MPTNHLHPSPPMSRVAQLLDEAGLPSEDLASLDPTDFIGCGAPDAPDGVIGLQVLGNVGLLRSLAVTSAVQGQGCGQALVAALEQHAARRGLVSLYLLTTTATNFFESLGYRQVDRANVPDAIRATSEFSQLCPDTADLLMKPIDTPASA
ncbi:MAG: arsenic resistance N-acetyltransferase ArsN2 [Pseudomonadota bacterium]